MIAIPKRMVLQGLTDPNCYFRIRENASQSIRVSFMSCCVEKIKPCIAQNADKTFTFYDADTVDYSLASEITFDVWDGIGGISLFSSSLSGGGITLVNDYTFTFVVTNAESGAMSKGNKYCEAWVTTAGGLQRCVGAGPFQVVDTRKHD